MHSFKRVLQSCLLMFIAFTVLCSNVYALGTNHSNPAINNNHSMAVAMVDMDNHHNCLDSTKDSLQSSSAMQGTQHPEQCQSCNNWHCQMSGVYLDIAKQSFKFEQNASLEHIYSSLYVQQQVERSIAPLLRPPRA